MRLLIMNQRFDMIGLRHTSRYLNYLISYNSLKQKNAIIGQLHLHQREKLKMRIRQVNCSCFDKNLFKFCQKEPTHPKVTHKWKSCKRQYDLFRQRYPRKSKS